MEDIRTSKTSKATCLACKLAMVSVQFLIYFKKKDREIASLGANICTDIGSYFDIRDRSVCDGMMNSLGVSNDRRTENCITMLTLLAGVVSLMERLITKHAYKFVYDYLKCFSSMPYMHSGMHR